MFLGNDFRILIKGFCLITFILGIFFPLIIVNLNVESSDNMVESFEDDLLVIYSNKVLEGSIDDSNDNVEYTVTTNNLLTYFILVMLITGIIIMTLSLSADLMEYDKGFIGNWYSAFVSYILFLLIYLTIVVKMFLLESNFTNFNDKLLYEEVQTSRGKILFFATIDETIWLKLIQISLISFLILPISNKIMKD